MSGSKAGLETREACLVGISGSVLDELGLSSCAAAFVKTALLVSWPEEWLPGLSQLVLPQLICDQRLEKESWHPHGLAGRWDGGRDRRRDGSTVEQTLQTVHFCQFSCFPCRMLIARHAMQPPCREAAGTLQDCQAFAKFLPRRTFQKDLLQFPYHCCFILLHDSRGPWPRGLYLDVLFYYRRPCSKSRALERAKQGASWQ